MMHLELWQWFDEVVADCKLDEAFGSVVGGSSRLIMRSVHTFDCVHMDRNLLCPEVVEFIFNWSSIDNTSLCLELTKAGGAYQIKFFDERFGNHSIQSTQAPMSLNIFTLFPPGIRFIYRVILPYLVEITYVGVNVLFER